MYSNALDLYATCDLTFLDVLAQYDSNSAEWSILETNLSQPELVSVFWTPMIFQIGTDDLSHAVKPYIVNRGTETVGVLASSMAKISLAYAAPLMTFTCS
ncbi:hypothetical protein M407DRAFT_244249 [Tulasnella calospora MUT 4182]|uniref:Uncharacterized protein n=1 Tax=Tulasnella calospora MUT 4182 TaxID=1051891 RepID=A0A0C3LU83_9AGAM|nr:hypothetical protein M407DRAFT_244249 [Tulasnella calospora MUT 4182]